MRRLLLAALAAAAACASLPRPRPPTSTEHGLVVARLRVRGSFFKFLESRAVRGGLAKLGSDGRPLPGTEAVSGRCEDGYLYFFDLPPGRYALAWGAYRQRGAWRRAELPPASAAERAAELPAGGAVFLGDHLLDARWPEGWEPLLRAARLAGRWASPWRRRPPLSADAEFLEVDRGGAAVGRALLAAREALRGTHWRGAVEAAVREEGVPEPAAESGGFRSRPLPLRQEASFAWRDTLGWGPPRRGPRGLEWRRPGGTARVAVYFTSSTAAGFQGYEAAVRELRAAAEAAGLAVPLEEVRVSTRTGLAGRSSEHRYPEGRLLGGPARVEVTETVLVRDPAGMYAARLRAEDGEFRRTLGEFRRFLTQLVLSPPGASPPPPPPDE